MVALILDEFETFSQWGFQRPASTQRKGIQLKRDSRELEGHLGLCFLKPQFLDGLQKQFSVYFLINPETDKKILSDP